MACAVECISPVSQIDTASGQERVAHVEKLELPEIAVSRIKGAHAVLKKDGGELGVRHKVPTNYKVRCNVAVNIQKPILFCDRPNLRKRQKRRHVP